MGGGDEDGAEAIQQASDGGYIVAGKTASFDPEGRKDLDFWVLKLKLDGSIGPSCNFIKDTVASGINSNATILETSASVRDSNVNPQVSAVKVRATNVSGKILCP